jgi:thiol-disulfide isomerase/thioredoxin
MKFHPIVRLSGMALALQFLAPTAMAAEKEKEHKLSQWKIGKVLMGPKLSKADLKGKVVVIENWGVNCPPCIASLPHLAELEKTNRDKGLVIIGAESQGSSKDEIKPLIEKAKVEYTITDGADGPIEFSAIPRCFVFDSAGLLVYDGSPSGAAFESAVEDALKQVGAAPATPSTTPAGPLIASRAWTNSDGQSITAAVKSADATTVTFIMANGKVVAYPLTKLSEESRKVIAEAAKTGDAVTSTDAKKDGE